MNIQKYSEDVYKNFGLDSFKKNWFSENGTLNGDYSWSIEIKNIVHRKKSKFQDIVVFDSKRFGRCLAMDNAVQVTEGDECNYHEMIVFIPLNSHPNPKKVLIIGGADGGIAREAVKHPSVQSVVVCEIDETAIEICKKYLPFTAKGLENPKVKVVTINGIEYLKKCKEEFDVIITDSPDPIGPAADLFEKPYFELLKAALKPGGVTASQAECVWFDTPKTKEFLDTCRAVFPVVDYASMLIPSFPGGQCGMVLCGKSLDTNFREPIHKFTTKIQKDFGLRYYTPDVHRAAFALPISLMKEFELKEDLYLY